MPIEGQNNSINTVIQPPNINVAATALPTTPRNTNPLAITTEQTAKQETINQEDLHKAPTATSEASRLEEIAKDWKYAKLSTWSMWATTLLSWLNPNSPSRSFESENPIHTKRAGIIGMAQDFFLRLRMMGQMTLHADPGNTKLVGDDVAMSNLHNITAQKFGMSSYKYHAFWSLPSWLLQNFVFTGKHPLSKIPNSIIKAFDRVRRIGTNMFWNIRRITLGLLPYLNNDLISMCSPNSEAYKKLREASAPVRTTMNKWTILLKAALHRALEKILPRPIMNFIETKLGFNFQNLREANRKAMSEPGGDINPLTAILKVGWENIKNNKNALLTGKHKSMLTGEIQDLRKEEPNTPMWYLKSKLIANILNPFIGLGSAIINTGSMVTGVLGEFTKDKSKALLSISQNLMDLANGTMSIVYMLGEVLGHASTVQQKYKNGEIRLDNLATLGIGVFGMGWRIVKGVFSTLAIPGMIFKPLGDLCKKVLHSRIDNLLDPLFLLFWSVNRNVSLKNSYKAEASTAGYAERKAAEKHIGISDVLSLPFKILTHDKSVTYDHPEALARAEALAAS